MLLGVLEVLAPKNANGKGQVTTGFLTNFDKGPLPLRFPTHPSLFKN